MSTEVPITTELEPGDLPSPETLEREEKARKRHVRQVSLRRRTLAFLCAGGILVIGWGAWLQYQNHQQLGIIATEAAAAKADASAAKITAEKDLISQNNHHAATTKADAEQTALLKKLNEEAAVIEYEGGVITYQSGELNLKDDQIIAAQAAGHALTVQIASLQQEINADVPELKTGLNTGQAQINTYLHYLTCLGTNPGNIIVCGMAPPLPAT